MNRRGFTLIELLIVVGIIALLAAIAVPNFMLAQVRAKVSRARSDLRSVAGAVESYAVDNNRYPPVEMIGGTNVLPQRLTTPISYMTSLPYDPFRRVDPTIDERRRLYDYHNVKQKMDDDPGQWPPNDLKRYGDWRLASYGPAAEYLPWIPYDPTNGTVSQGNVLRTQRSPEGKILYAFWDPANPMD